MRITFPFEALTKIGFLRIYFFNLFSENLNLPRHSFLRRLWEIWHWQYNFVTFLSLLFPPPNMKIPLGTIAATKFWPSLVIPLTWDVKRPLRIPNLTFCYFKTCHFDADWLAWKRASSLPATSQAHTYLHVYAGIRQKDSFPSDSRQDFLGSSWILALCSLGKICAP
jgi:hypothetical protein